MNNYVDVICLQECPQSILDPTVKPFGTPTNLAKIVLELDKNVKGWSTYYWLWQAWSETNPIKPQNTPTSDGYLIFYAKNTFSGTGACGYYRDTTFIDQNNTYLRPPVSLQLTLKGGATITVMNWHADTGGPQVTEAIAALNAGLGAANPNQPLTAVLGDFNYAGPVNNVFYGLIVPFPGWDDRLANITNNAGVPIAAGRDHILTSLPAYSALASVLKFKSDAHFPLAVDVP